METKIKYLVDTNIWLEVLLNQGNFAVASRFLEQTPSDLLFISDFSLHSIGVILLKYKKFDVFETFIDDLFANAKIELLSLEPLDLIDVVKDSQTYNFDFDDAYQFVVSRKYDLIIVTFDKDFNAKGIQKINPSELIDEE